MATWFYAHSVFAINVRMRKLEIRGLDSDVKTVGVKNLNSKFYNTLAYVLKRNTLIREYTINPFLIIVICNTCTFSSYNTLIIRCTYNAQAL